MCVSSRLGHDRAFILALGTGCSRAKQKKMRNALQLKLISSDSLTPLPKNPTRAEFSSKLVQVGLIKEL